MLVLMEGFKKYEVENSAKGGGSSLFGNFSVFFMMAPLRKVRLGKVRLTFKDIFIKIFRFRIIYIFPIFCKKSFFSKFVQNPYFFSIRLDAQSLKVRGAFAKENVQNCGKSP